MATANTVSRTSPKKISKKQTAANISTNNSSLTNLMLTAELLGTPSTNAEAQQESEMPPASATTVEIPSLWEAIRNSPTFSTIIIGLTCSFFVSAVFYSAAKTMMKIKFDEMFAEKLPRYKNLVYGIGSVQNIDADRVLLRDDLNDQYFVQDENNGSITIDVQKLFEQYKSEQPNENQESKEILIKHNAKNIINKFQDDQMDSVRVGLSQSV